MDGKIKLGWLNFFIYINKKIVIDMFAKKQKIKLYLEKSIVYSYNNLVVKCKLQK